MKKIRPVLSVLFLLAMLFSLCACGAGEEKPEDMQSVLPGADTQAESEAPVDEPAESSAPAENENKKLAEDLIGEDVSKLYEAIGEPNDSSYAGSCLGPGEDGELHYDGFTVYTYKENDSEIIQNVL